MFFKNSSAKQLFKDARALLRLSQKVVHFRKDLLSSATVTEIEQRQLALTNALAAKQEDEVEACWQHLHEVLSKHGGKVYPVTGWSDNIEMFLVAALVVIGIRCYFVQPFKIPTNSMYPTYGGMVPEVYTPEAPRPGFPVNVWDKFTSFASARTVIAPKDGELWVPVPLGNRGFIHADKAQSKLLGVLPRPAKQYIFSVGGEPVTMKVPADFDMQWVLRDTLNPQAQNFQSIADDLYRQNRFSQSGQAGIIWLHTGLYVKKGEPVIDFDIITGDMLLVDRFSYHFWAPEVGDPFVFRTRNIPSFVEKARITNSAVDDRYYIKRLVGKGGDELTVVPPVLYRNGQPIEGAEAFDKNNEALGEYEGYTVTYNMPYMKLGQVLKIPPNNYFAMGDNSDNSGDSREFGFVPGSELVGKPIFIYYPFTSRWGLAE